MGKTNIEWTDETWNPTTGCTKVSLGCRNCYAETMANRLQKMGCEKYKDGFEVRVQRDSLELPLKWKKPRRVFVNSMSDLFHPEIPLSYVGEVFQVMNRCPQHTFQVLTKRPELIPPNTFRWTPNIWMGVSVENNQVLERIDYLRKVPAHIRFLSCEPLIGPLANLNLDGIHWVIVGGETGKNYRPIDSGWVTDIQRQCDDAKVPFFFKSWGGRNPKMRHILGKTYDEYPG